MLFLYENMKSEFNSESLGPYCRSLHKVGVSYLWKLLHFECLIRKKCVDGEVETEKERFNRNSLSSPSTEVLLSPSSLQ